MQTRARDLAILAFDEVDLLDIAAPLEVLTEAGRNWNWRPFRVHVAARAEQVRTSGGLHLRTTTTLVACPPSEVLIVPGGYGARACSEDAEVLDWVRERAPQQMVLGCIGEGALVLARAGALGRDAIAAPPSVHSLLAGIASDTVLHHGASFFGARVQSARSGAGGASIGLAIVARLLSPRIAASLAATLDLPWTDTGGALGPADVIIRDTPSERPSKADDDV